MSVRTAKSTGNTSGTLPLQIQGYNLWWLLAEVNSLILKARQKELNQFDLSIGQASILYMIDKLGDKATAVEISQHVAREPNSLSGILRRMEKKGLVQIAPNDKRKGALKLSLTRKGKALYDRVKGRKAVHDIISCLSTEQRYQLRSCLDTLLKKVFEVLYLKPRPSFPDLYPPL